MDSIGSVCLSAKSEKKMLRIFLSFVLLSTVYGQQCQARFNQTISGQCSPTNNCQGSILSGTRCEQQRCCVPGAFLVAQPCLTTNNFDVLYNHSRAAFLRSVLNFGLSLAGICQNCQAKAAFLAVAATMTNDFQTDESTQTDIELAGDDGKYGNMQPGDGSRFRRRGFFGLRGRDMYQRLQTRLPQYQTLANPETAAIGEIAVVIAATLWQNPDLNNGKWTHEHLPAKMLIEVWYPTFLFSRTIIDKSCRRIFLRPVHDMVRARKESIMTITFVVGTSWEVTLPVYPRPQDTTQNSSASSNAVVNCILAKDPSAGTTPRTTEAVQLIVSVAWKSSAVRVDALEERYPHVPAVPHISNAA